MKALKLFIPTTLLIVALISCTSKTHQKDLVFEKGKIIEKIECRLDKSTNYALYLPSAYDTNNRYPVIIAFDSHGDGLIPVKLFQDQAEKFGYIVVGSNNSKNGLSWENNLAIYQSMIADIKERFSINESRIYTSGFSGGSRVASSIAILNGGIAGVVGFSAGFPNINQPITQKFDYLGVVGSSDFNFIEMSQLDKQLETMGFKHYLMVFNGKHEWPPKEIIGNIFYWMEFCAYRNQLSQKNTTVIDEFLSNCKNDIKTFQSKNDAFGEYQIYIKITRFLSDIIDIQNYRDKITALEKSANIQNELRLIELETEKEQKLQMYYQDAFSKNDINWWKKEVPKINHLISQNPDNRDAFLYQRVLNFLSICGYSYSNNALQTNQLDDANRFITIYLLVDPNNPDPHYFQAELRAKENDTTKVFESLENAIKVGFNDINKIQSDNNFIKFQSIPEWTKLLNKISNAKN